MKRLMKGGGHSDLTPLLVSEASRVQLRGFMHTILWRSALLRASCGEVLTLIVVLVAKGDDSDDLP